MHGRVADGTWVSVIVDPSVEAWQGDITTVGADVIVNAANAALHGGGGVDGAIHQAAGPGLLEECRRVHPDGCPIGEARVTGGHNLPGRWVIHTVGPQWEGGSRGEPELLADCYGNSLQAASGLGARTVAIPAVSAGIFRYPPEDAARVAVAAVRAFLDKPGHGIDQVILVAYDAETMRIYERLLEDDR